MLRTPHAEMRASSRSHADRHLDVDEEVGDEVGHLMAQVGEGHKGRLACSGGGRPAPQHGPGRIQRQGSPLQQQQIPKHGLVSLQHLTGVHETSPWLHRICPGCIGRARWPEADRLA